MIDGKWIDTIDLSKPCKEGKGLYRCYIHIPAEYIKQEKCNSEISGKEWLYSWGDF